MMEWMAYWFAAVGVYVISVISFLLILPAFGWTILIGRPEQFEYREEPRDGPGNPPAPQA
jgi:hypothetical protein